MKAHNFHEAIFPRATLLPNIGLLVEVGLQRPKGLQVLSARRNMAVANRGDRCVVA
jgi:hypothetical protein